MTKEKRKLTSKKVRALYLYPYRSKEENVIRGIVWMLSWLIGIYAQQTENQQALGGAYLIFSISLLLEFLSVSTEYLFAKIARFVFHVLLVMMVLGSMLLSFGQIPDSQEKHPLPYWLFVDPLPYIGWAVFVVIAIGTVLALVEFHKFFYDEDIENQREVKAEQDAKIEQFQRNLNGSPKGGDVQ